MNSHDSHEKIFPADPRITAYAFGELEGDELKLIEAAVAADPTLQAAVAELRGFGDTLSSALGEEPVEATSAPVVAAEPKPVKSKPRGRLIPFPLHYLATAAAACFALVVWVRHEDAAPKRQAMICEEPAKREIAIVTEAVPQAMAVNDSSQSSVNMEPTFAAGLHAAKAEVLESKTVESKKIPVAKPDISVAMQSPTFVPAPAMTTSPAEDSMARGRRLYLAGDIKGAEAEFKSQLEKAPENPAAIAFVDRIEKDKAQQADLNRAKTRAAMLAEVSSAWQRPSVYIEGAVTAPTGAVGGVLLGLDSNRNDSTNEAYSLPSENAYRAVATEPLSTFSVDVDTASYSNVRRFITGGRLPPRDAVRIEELINYFPYRYTTPKGDVPFAANLAVASAPWAPAHRLVRIGIKGRELTAATRSAANLVFLLDVSGSMNSPNKLPLVKESLRLLVERLRPDDRVAIVTYAGASGLALPSTPASRKDEILAALDSLSPGGSTNGAMGIHLAYDIAKANFVANGGINRVILCTDGDFNVGVTDRGALTDLVAEKAKSRVFLSVFGFGMGNLKDATLESLSGKGNGTYGYIDSRREAEKVFVEQVEGTLVTIAKDVKIQVEFNPARVASYRLVGYENRMLAKEDFNNDAVDAGDIGAGHTVTALYEIVPVGVDADGSARPAVDPLKYRKTEAPKPAATTGSKELLTVKIRYKAPEGDVSAKQEFPLVDGGATFAEADGEFRFAAAVAAWGMLLRDSPNKGTATAEQVIAWSEDGLANDAAGHRAEFVQLVRKSAEMK